MRNPGEVYYYVIDPIDGQAFGTLAEAAAEFSLPLTRGGEKILVEARVIRKRVLVTTEQELPPA